MQKLATMGYIGSSRGLTKLFLKLVLIWLSWKLFILIIGEEQEPLDERMFPALSAQWELLNNFVRKHLLIASEWCLRQLGYETVMADDYFLRVEGYGGIALGNYCLAFQILYYFTSLVVIAEMPLTRKIWGMAAGLILVQLLNILRITGLILVDVHSPKLMFLSHDYFFNLPVLGLLLLFYKTLIDRGNSNYNK